MSRPAKWILAASCAMTLLISLTVLLLHQKANQPIRRHESFVFSRRSELQDNGSPRTTIFGPPLPGKGWDLYLQAAAQLEAMDVLRGLPTTDFRLSANLVEDWIGPAWDSCAPIVDLVRQAVRCTDQIRVADPESVSGGPDFRMLCSLLKEGAVHLHRLGRDREAFDLLLLHTAVCRDTAGREYGGCGWSPEHDEEAAVTGMIFLADHSLSASDLGELAAQLVQLEGVRPSLSRQYRLQDALERQEALDGRLKGWDKVLPLEAGVRDLFLNCIASARALRQIEDAYHAYEEVEQLPLEKREAAAAGLGPPWRCGQAPGTCLTPTNNLYPTELAAVASWNQFRIGLALAHFQIDHGRAPDRLEDLVPRYLPAIPASCDPKCAWEYDAETMTLKGIDSREYVVDRRLRD